MGPIEENCINNVHSTKRKLPWVIDVFLYPTSGPGLIFIAIFIGISFLLGFVGKLLGPFRLVLLVLYPIRIAIAAYFFWYISECIRDSATGKLRAPETLASTPDISDMISQMLEIFGCVVIILGPVIIYSLITHKTDRIFWALMAYAVFFFPIGLLAVIMFGSLSALNPVLIIPSIFSTFFQYCGLVLLLFGIVLITKKIFTYQPTGILPLFFSYLAIHLTMVLAHLTGRFYWRYQRKLNWEV